MSKGKSKHQNEEEEEEDDAELAEQLAAAAVEAKHKNPHAESGRAKLPRSMRISMLDKSVSRQPKAIHNESTKDLFANESSSDSSSDESDNPSKHNVLKIVELNKTVPKLKNEKDVKIKPDKRETVYTTHEQSTSEMLHINKEYAEKYEQVKRKKELQQLTEKYGKKIKDFKLREEESDGYENDSINFMSSSDEDDNNDDEEDDEAVLLTEDNELAFAKALIAVRRAVIRGNVTSEHNNNISNQNKKNYNNEQDDNVANKVSEKRAKNVREDERKSKNNNTYKQSVENCNEEQKDWLKNANFFPPVETQMERNARVYAEAMAAKREKKKAKFILADEYRRAVQSSSNDAEEGDVQTSINNNDDDNNNNSDENNSSSHVLKREQSSSHKVRPQSEEEKKLRDAFLTSVQESTSAFEITAANTENITTNKVKSRSKAESKEHATNHSTVNDEKRRLLEEAFSIKPITRGKQYKENTLQHGKNHRSECDDDDDEEEEEEEGRRNALALDNDEDNDDANEDSDEENEAFIRDFFVQELWRPENNNSNKANMHSNDKHNGCSSHNDKTQTKLTRNGGLSRSEDAIDSNDVLAENGLEKYTMEQLAQEEADEAFYRDAELWEREYQEKKYRHEEERELAGQIRSFPRLQGNTIATEGLLRKLDTSRRDARERRRARLLEERQRQVEELKRLKHLKRKEIEEQRALIASVAGLQMAANDKKQRQQQQQQQQEQKRTASTEVYLKRKNKQLDETNLSESNNVDEETVKEECKQRSHRSDTNDNSNNEKFHVKSMNELTETEQTNPLESKLRAIWSEKDLDAPYDAAEFDKKMAMLFDEEYYDEKNVDDNEIAYIEAELDDEFDNEDEMNGNTSTAVRENDELNSKSEDVNAKILNNEQHLHVSKAKKNKVIEDEDTLTKVDLSVEDESSNLSQRRSHKTSENTKKKEKLQDAANESIIMKEENESILKLCTEKKEQMKKHHSHKQNDEDTDCTFKLSNSGNYTTDNEVLDHSSNEMSSIDVLLSKFEKREKKAKNKTSEHEEYATQIDDKDNINDANVNFNHTSRSGDNHALLNDPLTLLYPSLALEQFEKSSLEQKQIINTISTMTSSKHHKENDSAQKEHVENNTDETLHRLQAELKRKEEEYNELHHKILDEHGVLSSNNKLVESMPFRYRSVPPEDFTLTVEEILARDDRQLNMIAPISCYAAYLDRYHNRRDREKIERIRKNGLREIDVDRHSRRYGDVSKTVILDPAKMSVEEGEAMAERLRKRLRDEDFESNSNINNNNKQTRHESFEKKRSGRPMYWKSENNIKNSYVSNHNDNSHNTYTYNKLSNNANLKKKYNDRR